ncbi:hypothetical protein EYC84_005430 [Monilinia fructicola]|uniref:Uncharacterized protein n=1 Tax=Monilinia fructicola TaxID=38448 RepID=A0A5M9JXC8_MONFR|nr:hypothetical protein EYC84_005430 [Monilinia fructicola]
MVLRMRFPDNLLEVTDYNNGEEEQLNTPFEAQTSRNSVFILAHVSNDSNTSLLSSTRRPNGSNLKQAAAPPNVPDPLEVLGKLLYNGEDLKSPSGKGQRATNGTPPPIGQEDDESEWDFGGLSLQDIVAGDPFDNEDEHVYKAQTLEEYERDKDKFEDLHRSIRACDDVLNSVEINLTSFQNDLAMVSAEIETLQARSTALSVRLENRKVVENGLGPIVEEISVSPAVVKKIVDGPIDEAWVRALAEVEKRYSSLRIKTAGPPHDAFNLGRRIDLLKTSNQNALPSFLAEEDKQTHYMEFPFRNFNLALIDNASAEYSFLTSFFSPSLTYATISRHFNYIFEPTFALGQSSPNRPKHRPRLARLSWSPPLCA